MLLLAVLALLLSGCGFLGSTTGKRVQPGPSLTPSPIEVATPDAAASAAPSLARFYGQKLTWKRCRDTDECSTLTVPLDYAKPAGRTVTLSLLKVPARDAKRRVGSLIVDPGGPGGSGVDYAASGASSFGPELLSSFDIVGFDPRGVGRSTPLKCEGTADLDLDHLPGVAQVAIQGAKYAAKEIKARLSDSKAPQRPFKYFDKGSMATISRFKAVALVGKIRVSGFVAWLMWLGVHLVYLTGFKNRLGALGHWAVSFLGRGRSERTATEQQIFARAALQRLKGGASDLVSSPGDYEATQSLLEASRRAELEAQAAEEARLTDSGERGVHQDEAAPVR